MGCGHSKLSLYSRRGKGKERSKKSGDKASDQDSDCQVDSESSDTPEVSRSSPQPTTSRAHPTLTRTRPLSINLEVSDVENEESDEDEISPEAPEEAEPEESPSRQLVLPIAEHQPTFEVSMSQQNFFKMLDEKIEQGKDYDSSSESEVYLEQERKRRILAHWLAHTQTATPPPPPETSPPSPQRQLTRSISKISERQCAPGSSKACYWQESPARRSHGLQTNEPGPSTSEFQPARTPLKRTQSAPTWRSTRVGPMPQNEAGPSQITLNPTFQTHSPKNQPLRAQIVQNPSRQTSRVVTPPDQYQDPEIITIERHMTVKPVTQSQIYYIQGSNLTTSPELLHQRQQTAIHLQQYVAMKQAQEQHVYTSYMQRGPIALLPDSETSSACIREGEQLAAQYGYPGPRPTSAPNRSNISHTHTPTWTPLPPIMTPWNGEQIPPEMQYYPQSQFVPMYRANSAGSAGTLTRLQKKGEESVISVVRGKQVGQIMASTEGLTVSTATDSSSPASVSTDSGVSPGTSSSPKSSSSTTPPTTSANDTIESKPKKKKGSKCLKLSKSLDA